MHNIPPVELVPHHAVVKAGGLLHQALGKGGLVVKARVQKAVLLDGLVAVLLGFREEGLVVFHPVVGRDHQIGGIFLRLFHQQAGGVRSKVIITVGKLQVFAGGHRDGQIPGGGHPAVGLVDEQDAFVHPGVHVRHLQAHVAAAVVHQNDLQVLIALLADALHAAGDVKLRVVDRHDHADQRLLHP